MDENRRKAELAKVYHDAPKRMTKRLKEIQQWLDLGLVLSSLCLSFYLRLRKCR